MQTEPELLSAAQQAFVIAPAGFGKTELIARSIELTPGKSLVLTHTHSGVSAMRQRLQRYGIPRQKFDVATIAGWALRYASSYPALSGLSTGRPTGPQWPEVYEAANQLLQRKVVRGVLGRTYSGAFVDEYQDCNLAQHGIVLAISSTMPCRLLGDPMQAIFDFAEPTIDWLSDVIPNYRRLPDLLEPHRWASTNPALGKWLLDARAKLISGATIDLQDAPLTWYPDTPKDQHYACFAAARDKDSSVVAVRKWANDCHHLASRMSGLYGSMEELDCQALMQFARDLDAASDGRDLALHLIDLAGRCFTVVGSELEKFRTHYLAGQLPDTSKLTKNHGIVQSINSLVLDSKWQSFITAARLIERYPDAKLYRRELWSEMKTTILTFMSGVHETLEATAWFVRDRSRRNGRQSDRHVISRTLLVKGLEFDHAVVLDTKKLNAKEAYVALTRGRRTLTVLASEPSLQFHAPENQLDSYP